MNPRSDFENPRKPRIAFLHGNLWAGGSTTFLINLAGELVRRGIPTHVFSMEDIHSQPEDFERRHIPVFVDKSRGTIFEDRILHSLEEMSRFAPDVVVMCIGLPSCEAFRHLPPGIFRVGVVHAATSLDEAVQYAGVMDCIVTVSEPLRDALAGKLELNALPIRHLELGIPISPTVHRENLVSERPLRILYLGRLEDHAKRVRLFPKILLQLKKSGIAFVWTIAGDGPERLFLESSMIGGNENQCVCFKGLVAYSDVPALMAENDILLLTSDAETFSLSLHEGMVAGLVPVVSDLPGRIREVVAADAGILVSPDNVNGYADAIVWLHKNRETMQAMSVRSRELIGQKHSVEAMTDRWLELLTVPKKEEPVWPSRWKLLPPLFAPHSWWFSPPMRQIRRLAAKARGFFGG